MTDPLGQSQVLPYLLGLSKHGYKFTILSFEKPKAYRELRATIEAIMKPADIQWVPLSFTSKPPLVAKFYDVMRMRIRAMSLYRKYGFDMIHCRSYPAADIGLLLKRKFGVRFFFDMRGFWADEKRDGGAWSPGSPLFRRVYSYYKRKEVEYLQNADHIISLTNAGRKEMTSWSSYKKVTPVDVIPCCADLNHFTLTDAAQKASSRKLLGLRQKGLVISYLGSIGSWYMLDEMLLLFSLAKRKYPEAIFLFITHSEPLLITSKLDKFNLTLDDIHIVKASRLEVPLYTKASDINVSFIKPVYSKISSSPTKLGEVLAMGIPVISNSGVGDVEAIIKETDSGIVVHGFSEDELQKAVDAIGELLNKSPQAIRERSEKIYSLERGISAYKSAYENALSVKTE
jgi:glycosyltransferase involved in cell wall biosynthesis